MKSILLTFALAVPLGLGISSCSLPPAIRGNGLQVSETRDIADFHSVSIGGSGRAVITQGDTESLEIQADENLLPYIQSEVRNGQLRIWTRRGNLRFTHPPTYTIGVRQLERLDLSGSLHAEIESLKTDRLSGGVSGSGSIQVGQLQAGSVDLGISGSGKIVFDDGTAESLDLSISGSGDLQAEGVEAEEVHVSISGSGNAQVWPTKSLEAQVSGSGDIRYRGDPTKVSSSISGSGRVQPLR